MTIDLNPKISVKDILIAIIMIILIVCGLLCYGYIKGDNFYYRVCPSCGIQFRSGDAFGVCNECKKFAKNKNALDEENSKKQRQLEYYKKGR